MDNNDIIIISDCKNCAAKINALNKYRSQLNNDYKTFEKDGEANVEAISIFALFAAVAAILILIFIGFHWIIAIILGCLVGGILDKPFKVFRKLKYKISLSLKQKDFNKKITETDNEIALLSKNDSFLYVKGIIGDYCYNEVCLNFILDCITKSPDKTIRIAFNEYIQKIDEERKKADEAKRKVEEERRKTEEARRRSEENRRREEQRKREEKKQEDFNRQNSYSHTEINYFQGCTTLDTLVKRYKQLAKCYHPDTGIGDEATMKIINGQFETLKKKMS